MPDRPIDLPGNPLADQLVWVANWAGIPQSPLLERQSEISAVFKERKKLIEILLQCCPDAPWAWPAYEEMVAAALAQRSEDYLDDDELPTADDAREFHTDALRDMAAHIADKLVSNHHALYRKGQIEAVPQYLRPFWQLVGPCVGTGKRKTLMANDPSWLTHCLPWQSSHFLCRCQFYSLSRIELKRYVEGGCAPGDEAAAKLLHD